MPIIITRLCVAKYSTLSPSLSSAGSWKRKPRAAFCVGPYMPCASSTMSRAGWKAAHSASGRGPGACPCTISMYFLGFSGQRLFAHFHTMQKARRGRGARVCRALSMHLSRSACPILSSMVCLKYASS